MLDCHTHVLPGIDDGAPDLDTSLGILTRMHAAGVATVVATPHWRSPRFAVEPDGIAAAWERLTDRAARELPTLRLVLGAEHHLSGLQAPEAFAADLRPLGDSRLVLVELPDDHLPANAAATLFAVLRSGRRPIIAHPERCKGLAGFGDGLAALLESGVLLQLTLGSLLGRHGFMMRWRSRGLLRRHPRACIIASDSHDLGVRRPRWDELPQRWRGQVPGDLDALADWG